MVIITDSFFILAFYKPGEGVTKEIRFHSPHWSLDIFDDLTNYPDCPSQIENVDNFKMPSTSYATYANYHQIASVVYRFRAYFIPSQTGYHIFNGYCNNICRISIEISPGTMKQIIERNGSAFDADECWNW